MLALLLATGAIGGPGNGEQGVSSPVLYGGDDAPRSPLPIIYLWPERKIEAIEAIEAVEDETEATNTAPQSEAVADLREAIETDAAAAIIRTTLARAETLFATAERRVVDAHRAALIEDMRQAALAAAMAREQTEIELALALCLLV